MAPSQLTVVLFALAAPLTVHCSLGSADADERTGALSSTASSLEDGFYFDVYSFEADSQGFYVIDLRSQSFDAWLTAISPDGDILDNDDSASGRDARLEILSPKAGKWQLVVTSFSGGEVGPYAVSINSEFKAEVATVLDDITKTAVFAERSERSGAMANYAAEVAYSRRVRSVSERLQLAEYRSEISGQLQSNLASNRQREVGLEEKSLQLRATLESLAAARTESENSMHFGSVLEPLIVEELNSTAEKLDLAIRDLARLAEEVAAFETALMELSDLEEASRQLDAAVSDLLSAPRSETIFDLQGSASDLKQAIERIRREFATKLIESRYVDLSRLQDFGVHVRRDEMLHNQVITIHQTLAAHAEATSAEVAETDVAEPDERMAEAASPPSRPTLGLVLAPPPIVPAESASPPTDHSQESIDNSPWLPALLPWPPPASSARMVLPREQVVPVTSDGEPVLTLGQIDARLGRALAAAGYDERGYFGVPNGFAIVTRLEQIRSDGSPSDGTARWLAEVDPLARFSLNDYVRALFWSPAGHFRVLMFIVTDQPFGNTNELARRSTIQTWARTGLNVLPDRVAENEFGSAFNVTMLVYEFRKSRAARTSRVLLPGLFPATVHLTGSRIAVNLGRT